jgi:hypothetical protein
MVRLFAVQKRAAIQGCDDVCAYTGTVPLLSCQNSVLPKHNLTPHFTVLYIQDNTYRTCLTSCVIVKTDLQFSGDCVKNCDLIF